MYYFQTNERESRKFSATFKAEVALEAIQWVISDPSIFGTFHLSKKMYDSRLC